MKKTKIGSTNVHVLRWFYKCHCSVCVALCRSQPYLFCVWKTSLTRFDVKHKDRQYYRPSLQEITSALWGPLLTIAVRTFPLILDRGSEMFSTKSQPGVSLKGFTWRQESAVRGHECISLLRLGTHCGLSWQWGRLDSVHTCLTKDTRYDIATSTQRSDGEQRRLDGELNNYCGVIFIVSHGWIQGLLNGIVCDTNRCIWLN